jgi:hypothetical protein
MISVDNFQQIDLPVESIIIKEDTILSLLGYESDTVDPYVLETIQDCILRCKYLFQPKGGFIFKTIIPGIPSDGVITLNSTELHCGKIICGQIKKASTLCIFAVTIGKKTENLSEQLFHKGDMLEGYIINLIGSEAAESAAEYLHNYIKTIAQHNDLNSSNRFSPGYCNWNVAEQFKLFSCFSPEFKEITLTESALMNPVKSVSGIIGIGEEVKYRDYACSLCTMENCLYRKKR